MVHLNKNCLIVNNATYNAVESSNGNVTILNSTLYQSSDLQLNNYDGAISFTSKAAPKMDAV